MLTEQAELLSKIKKETLGSTVNSVMKPKSLITRTGENYRGLSKSHQAKQLSGLELALI